MDYEWYNIGLPFITWADINIELGEWSDGRENKMLTAMWSLSDSMSLTVMVMADVKDDDMSFGDAVSLHFKHKF